MNVKSSSSFGTIEKGTAAGAGIYWTVKIDAGKLVTPSGKTLPYATWIGTIGHDGKINLWRPAAGGLPRDYQKGAMPLLLVAYKKLLDDGLLKPSPTQARRYEKFVSEYHWYI